MKKSLTTKRGYDLYEVASALQKAIRRNETAIAGYFALELLESGYHNYVWKKLLTISAEDCHGVITQEIDALRRAFEEQYKPGTKKGRIFLSKAVIILSQAPKNRDADHLTNLVYDTGVATEAAEKFLQELDETEIIDIPEYAFDCHTIKGKRRGKTKQDFFIEEFEALKPRQPGLFDEFVPKKNS